MPNPNPGRKKLFPASNTPSPPMPTAIITEWNAVIIMEPVVLLHVGLETCPVCEPLPAGVTLQVPLKYSALKRMSTTGQSANRYPEY
jgi:hypothetical protein